jgi:molybdopterin-guanine dinucleotide biosynthesis protein A
MPFPQPFSAMLLAGGRSTRMGMDKAAVMVDGEMFWVRQVRRLQACGAAEVFISGRIDGPYSTADIPIAEDLHPDLGPLSGLEAGLRHARHDWLLVLAIDLIAVPVEFLAQLANSAMVGGRGLYPVRADWFQPLAAVYPRSCLPLVERCLAGDDRSMKHFLRMARQAGLLDECPLEPQQLAWFRNINSPADLTARLT